MTPAEEQERRMAPVFKAVSAACRDNPNIEDALAVLIQGHAKDKERLGLSSDLITEAYRNRIHDWRHENFKRVKISECDRGAEAIGATVGVAAGAAALSILRDWTLPDGRPLGEALGAEVAQIAEGERNIADGHFKRASFLQAIADKTPAKGKVKNSWTASQARDLWRLIAKKAEESVA